MVKTLKTFYSFLFRYKKAFLSFIFVVVLATVLENLAPYIYKLLIDAIPLKNYQLLIKLAFLFVGMKIATNLTDSLSYFLGDRVWIAASRDARLKIFGQLQDLDFAFHINKSTGSLISALKRGEDAFSSFFYNIHHQVLRVFISLFVVLFFFIQITPLIAVLLIFTFLLNCVVGWHLIKINIRKRIAFNEAEDEVSGIITDNLINYETVKFFAQEKTESIRLKKQFRGWIDKLWGYFRSFRLMDIAVGTLSNLGILVIFAVVISKLARREIGIGDLVMVVSFSTSFYYRFFDLLYHFRNIAKNNADIERYFAILDEKILVKDPKRPVQLKSVKGEIKFENVSFNYPEKKERILANINLYIKPGESVAFVGRSGVGKTTLIRLLLRFYDVDSGRILLDGNDIRDFAKSQFRSFIGVVPQEPILFSNTIGFNIAYGNKKASKEQIIEKSKMANLHHFIESLPKKYQTQVGERGIKLSSGQKQRLAIARMLLIDPKIIIFDEATSNLDSESERLIQDALWKIAKKRTVLIIAHRFATVRRADKIVVLDEGRIVEIGSHEELLTKKGVYNYLWGLQSKEETQPSN